MNIIKTILEKYKTIISLLVGLLLLLYLIGIGQHVVMHRQISDLTEEFFTRLAYGKYEEAREISSPGVVKRDTDIKIEGKKEISTKVYRLYVLNRHYVEADVRLKNEVKPNDTDISWYRIAYIKDKKSWRIVHINHMDSYITDGRRLTDKDKEDITRTCNLYLNAIREGKYALAAEYLSGKARMEQEMQAEVMPKVGLEVVKSAAEIKFLGKTSEDIAVAEMSYVVEDRKVKVIVKAVKADNRWKLMDIYVLEINKVENVDTEEK